MARSHLSNLVTTLEVQNLLKYLCCDTHSEPSTSHFPPTSSSTTQTSSNEDDINQAQITTTNKSTKLREHKAKIILEKITKKASRPKASIPSSLSAPQLSVGFATTTEGNNRSERRKHGRSISLIEFVKKVKRPSFHRHSTSKMSDSKAVYPVFPIEIWLEIADWVEDKETLAALSCMNKPIRREIAKRMFSKVVIKEDGSDLTKLDIIEKYGKNIKVLKINDSALNPDGPMGLMLDTIVESGYLQDGQLRMLQSAHSGTLSEARGLQTKIMYAYTVLKNLGIKPTEVHIDIGPDYCDTGRRFMLFQFFGTVAQAIYPIVKEMDFPEFKTIRMISEGKVLHTDPWFGHHFLHSNPPPSGRSDGSITDYMPFYWRFEPYHFCRDVSEMFPGRHSFGHLLHGLAGEPCPFGINDPDVDIMIRGVIVELKRLSWDHIPKGSSLPDIERLALL